MRRDGLPPAVQLERADRLQLDAVTDEARGAGADEDLAPLRRLLEAGGEVDGLAGGEGGVAVVGDDLARLDPDPGLEAELLHLLEGREAGAHGALGVVLVRERDAEGGHHRVAGELLDRAAVRDDAVRDLVEEPVHTPAHDLGIGVGDELRGRDEVHEEDGCQLPLHPLNGSRPGVRYRGRFP